MGSFIVLKLFPSVMEFEEEGRNGGRQCSGEISMREYIYVTCRFA